MDARALKRAHTRTSTQVHIINVARFSAYHHICVVSTNSFIFLSVVLHSNTTSSFAPPAPKAIMIPTKVVGIFL